MALTGKAKRKIKTVANKLKKASKAHAGQSKILSGLLSPIQTRSLLPSI